MNSIERIEAVLSHQKPDCVPVSQPNFLVTAHRMGVSDFADYFRDGEAMAQGQVKTWERFGHDLVIIENGTAALAEACGVEVIYQSSTAPVATEPAIQSMDEVDQLKVPDPYQHPILKEMLLATRRVVEQIGNRAFIMGRADQGPFSLACEIRGMSQFMMDIALGEQPDKIHQLLDYCRQVVYRYALAQIDQGAHSTSIGESPSGPDLLSPRHYRVYAHPHVKQLMFDLNSKKVRCSYHICGNATPIIAEMVGTGAPMIEIDQKADMQKCKLAAKTKAILIGQVDPSEVMAKGTPGEVIENCKQAIDILGMAGGFILGPGCALPGITPEDNIDAMVQTARTYGRY